MGSRIPLSLTCALKSVSLLKLPFASDKCGCSPAMARLDVSNEERFPPGRLGFPYRTGSQDKAGIPLAVDVKTQVA